MRVLLPTHDASVHKLLKLLASITPCTEFSLLQYVFLQERNSVISNPSGLGGFILQAKVLPFILSMCALILLGSLDSTTVLHQAFHYHLMNQRLCIYVILPSQCLLFCTCRWPFQHVKVVCILQSFSWGDKALYMRMLGLSHWFQCRDQTNSKFLLGMSIGAPVIENKL